jgi:hypothetical protein
MNWGRFALAVVVSGTAITFTDWFFFGVLFHEEYNAYPEVWRVSQAGNRAIWIAIGFFTSAIFIYACTRLRLYEYGEGLKLALWMWSAIALPIIATDALFIKLHPLVVVSHSLGWLTRLAAAALSVRLVLRSSVKESNP